MHAKTSILVLLALAGAATASASSNPQGGQVADQVRQGFVKLPRHVNLVQERQVDNETDLVGGDDLNSTEGRNSNCSGSGRPHRGSRHGQGRGKHYWRHANGTSENGTSTIIPHSDDTVTLPVESSADFITQVEPTESSSVVEDVVPSSSVEEVEVAPTTEAVQNNAAKWTRTRTSTSSTKSASSSSSSSAAVTSAAPVTTSSAAASPSGGTSSGSAPSGFSQEILAAHNAARSTHDAPAMTWSDSLTALAKTWGDKCVWEHGGANGAGQNLAAGTGSQSGQSAVDMWMSEEKDYNPSSPNYSHFTQVVWKASTELGCYQSKCSKLVDGSGKEVFPGFGDAVFTICNYSPAGNVIGQFADNVSKTS